MGHVRPVLRQSVILLLIFPPAKLVPREEAKSQLQLEKACSLPL